MTEDHDLDLESDFDGKWEAYCSCGWTSPPEDAERDAMFAWEMHCDAVFIEATQP